MKFISAMQGNCSKSFIEHSAKLYEDKFKIEDWQRMVESPESAISYLKSVGALEEPRPGCGTARWRAQDPPSP